MLVIFFVQNTEPHRTSMFSLGLMTDSLYQFVFELHVYTLVIIVIIVVSDEGHRLVVEPW